MDYESALISAIVLEKRYTEVVDAGVVDELFIGSKPEWEYIQGFHRNHGQAPPPEQFDKLFPEFEMQLSTGPISFLVEELQKRFMHNRIAEGMQEAAKHLKAKDPVAAREALQAQMMLIDATASPSNDVNMTQNPEARVQVYRDLVAMGGITGYRSPWPVLDDVTLGFQKQELSMLVARGGVGKCIEASSRIVDPITGVERTIRDVVLGDQMGVLSWDRKDGMVNAVIDNKVDTGRKRCLTYKTESGREITVTPEHPFLTPTGWVQARALDEGDYIALPASIPEPLRPKALTKGLNDTRMLALLLAEGSYTGNHVGFSTADPALLAIAERFVEGTPATVEHRENYDYDITVGNVGGHTPNPARELLRRLGIDDTLAKHKRIPDEVYSLPDMPLEEFLGVFWMCDGYIDRGVPAVALASRRMVEQLQHLLLRFGIQSSVLFKPVKGGFSAWRLRVYSHCAKQFLDRIPLWGEKKQRLTEHVNSGRPSNPNVGGPRWRAVKGMDWDQPGVHWDRIKEVESAGNCKIYDLTVGATSCFIANDIIVHNTWAEVILALFFWQSGYVPLLFTNEMAVSQIIRRADAKNAQLPYQRFRAGQLTQEEFDRWEQSLRDMKDGLPFWVSGDDDGSKGVAGVEAKIIRYRPTVVLIDGVALMQDEESAGSGWEKLHNISRGLKKVARRQNLPIIVSHWFSKDGQGTEGTADDLKFGDVQNHYDFILGMYQDEAMRLNKEMLMRILKQREGEQLEFVTDWDLEAMRHDVKQMGQDDLGDDDTDEELNF